MKGGGLTPRNAVAICETSKTFWPTGKTLSERRFGEPFKRPIIPFGSMDEYHPMSPRDQARIHQLGKKKLPGIFLVCELVAGIIWKGDFLIADLEDLAKWMHQTSIFEEATREEY